jgi:hypothetical protein
MTEIVHEFLPGNIREKTTNRPIVGTGTAAYVPPPLQADILIQNMTTNRYVEFWKTDKPIIPKAGYGGHPLAARPKRAALTVFEGRQPFSLEVPCLLYADGQSVQQARSLVEEMATSPFKGYKSRPEPPRVRITAQPNLLPPMPNVGRYFWVEDLTWEDEYRESDWTLYFNVVTITLLEALNDEVLQEEETSAGRTSPRKLYIVKAGDTLHSIAANELHNAGLWKKIGELNGIRSDGKLVVGSEIKLPT